MYGVFWESRIKVSEEQRAVLETTPEGRKMLQRNAVWGRDKHPSVSLGRKAAAEQIAFILTEDRKDNSSIESRYIVVDLDI